MIMSDMFLPRLTGWLLGPLAVLFLLTFAAESRSAEGGKAIEAGSLLVASQDMADPRFRESVILIVRHDQHGTIGLIINRPSEIPLTHALPMLKALPKGAEYVFFGGPVQFQSMLSILIRSDAEPRGMDRVFDNVYVASGFNNVARAVSSVGVADEVRTFGGYAGWAPGQLEAEVARGGWVVFQANAKKIFSRDPAALWQEYMEESGNSWDWVMNDVPWRDYSPRLG